MASTNKTANLGLNQWVLSDPFLMEDFNSDNQKIDGAVNAIPYLKLMDVKTTSNAQQVDLDISTIDFSKYAMIHVITNAQTTPFEASSQIYARINNRGGVEKINLYGSTMTNQNYVARTDGSSTNNCPANLKIEISGLLLEDTHNVIRIRSSSVSFVSGILIHESFMGMYFEAGTKPMTINFLSSNSNTQIKKGSRFLIYGVRA